MRYANKRICVLGDSIAENGGYIAQMRAACSTYETGTQIFNRGIGGNRACMAKALLDDEIFWLKPDVVLVCFGINDLGIWLYDARITPIEAELNERKRRMDECVQGYRDILCALKSRRIEAFFCSAYCVKDKFPSVE